MRFELAWLECFICASAHWPSRISTGASVGSPALPDATGIIVSGITHTYTRTATPAVIASTFNGTSHTGLNFGDVDNSTFAPPTTKSGAAGTSLSYAHTCNAQTAGSVIFTVASSVSSPVVAGWSEKICADPGCSDTLQVGAAVLYPGAVATAVTAGRGVCIIVQESVPSVAQNGSNNNASIRATLPLRKANPSTTAPYTLNDIAQVSSTAFVSANDGTTPATLAACAKTTPLNPLPAATAPGGTGNVGF